MKSLITHLAALAFLSCNQTPPPGECSPTPSKRQLAWYKMGFYAFAHFNMGTSSGIGVYNAPKQTNI
ncbi:hypothetical protein MNBD_BACTEROID01-812 [hydrothermal vent metagenome]|uniref:Lipoprotein n=1 Tax=hydrothermal vent metagenome TaxID=652676 RepID=A0A3B0UL74_9ZZZZ